MSWSKVPTRLGGYAPQGSDWALFQQILNTGTRVRLAEKRTTVDGSGPITFDSFDLSFQHLLLEYSINNDAADAALICRVNGVATATYDYQTLETTVDTGGALPETAPVPFARTGTLTGAYIGRVTNIGRTPKPSINTLCYGIGEALFFDYADNTGTKEKTCFARSVFKRGDSPDGIEITTIGTFIRQTAGITQLEIRGNATTSFLSGCRATLWGIPK